MSYRERILCCSLVSCQVADSDDSGARLTVDCQFPNTLGSEGSGTSQPTRSPLLWRSRCVFGACPSKLRRRWPPPRPLGHRGTPTESGARSCQSSCAGSACLGRDSSTICRHLRGRLGSCHCPASLSVERSFASSSRVSLCTCRAQDVTCQRNCFSNSHPRHALLHPPGHGSMERPRLA